VGDIAGTTQDCLEQESAGAGGVVDAAVGELAVFDQVQQISFDFGRLISPGFDGSGGSVG